MHRRLAAAPLALVALLLVAACGGGAGRLPAVADPDLLPVARDLRDLLGDMDEGDSVYARRRRPAGLPPAVEGRFRRASGAVVAFIPGRHPSRSGELVLAVAPMGTPAAAVLLEEARLLSARAAYAVTPVRTVLVGFLPPGGGSGALGAVLDAPVWTLQRMVGVIVVGGDVAGGAYEAEGAARGVSVEVVVAPGAAGGPVEQALALAGPLRAALMAWASPESEGPAPSDTTLRFEPHGGG